MSFRTLVESAGLDDYYGQRGSDLALVAVTYKFVYATHTQTNLGGGLIGKNS